MGPLGWSAAQSGEGDIGCLLNNGWESGGGAARASLNHLQSDREKDGRRGRGGAVGKEGRAGGWVGGRT